MHLEWEKKSQKNSWIFGNSGPFLLWIRDAYMAWFRGLLKRATREDSLPTGLEEVSCHIVRGLYGKELWTASRNSEWQPPWKQDFSYIMAETKSCQQLCELGMGFQAPRKNIDWLTSLL